MIGAGHSSQLARECARTTARPLGSRRRPLRWRALALGLLGLALVLEAPAARAQTAQIETLFVIVDFADVPAPSLVQYFDGSPKALPLTSAGAASVFFESPSNPSSTAARYSEMSYQQVALVGDVVEVGLALTLGDASLAEWRPAANAAAVALGYDPALYDRTGYLLPFGFEGQLGNGGASQAGAWFWATPPTASSLFLNERTVRHELGHTFGMRHAAELQPGGSVLEVADESCFLGSGDAVHAHALNKRTAGWLAGGRWIEHPQDALSSYALRGLGEPAILPQALAIATHGALDALGAPVDTVLSFRPAVGLDTIPIGPSDPYGTPLLGTVHLHHARRDGKGFPTLERALGPGDSAVVNGATVRVLSIAAGEATVEIDQQAYLPSPPVVQVVPVAGATAMPNETIEFAVEVTNVDPAGVDFPAWYTSAFAKPTAFWSVAWDVTPKEILVGPGATETIDGLRVRAPMGTPPGIYSVAVTLATQGSAGPVETTASFEVEIVPSPDTTPPPPPSGLGGTIFAGGDDYVVLSWTEPADVSDVAVYQPYRNGVALPTPASRNPIYLDFFFSGSESNAYVVRSVDAAGNESSPSDVFTAGVPDTTPPDPPGGLGGSAGSGGIELTWSVPFDDVWVAAYEVRRDGVAIGTSTEARFVDTAPPLGTSTYAVVALDGYGNASAASASWQNEIAAVPALPPAATALLALALAATGAAGCAAVRGASGGRSGRAPTR